MRIFQFAVAAVATAFVANQANAIAIEESEDIYATLAQSEIYSEAEPVKTSDPAVMKEALKKTQNPVIKGKGRSDPSENTKAVAKARSGKKVITNPLLEESIDAGELDADLVDGIESLKPKTKVNPNKKRTNNAPQMGPNPELQVEWGNGSQVDSEADADDVDVDMSFRDNLNHVSNKDKKYIKNGKDTNSGAATAKRMNREAMSSGNTNASQYNELMNAKEALNKVKKEDKNYMAHGFDNNDGDAVYKR